MEITCGTCGNVDDPTSTTHDFGHKRVSFHIGNNMPLAHCCKTVRTFMSPYFIIYEWYYYYSCTSSMATFRHLIT